MAGAYQAGRDAGRPAAGPGAVAARSAITGGAVRRVAALEAIAPQVESRAAFIAQANTEVRRRAGSTMSPQLGDVFMAAVIGGGAERHREAVARALEREFDIAELEAIAQACRTVPDLRDRLAAVANHEAEAAKSLGDELWSHAAATLARGAAAPQPAPGFAPGRRPPTLTPGSPGPRV
jgi:hypothetical protein